MVGWFGFEVGGFGLGALVVLFFSWTSIFFLAKNDLMVSCLVCHFFLVYMPASS